MKVAKVHEGSKWLVHDGERGWVGHDGSIVQPQASARHTKFYKGVAEAKADGFSPTASQAAVISKWAPAKPEAKVEDKK